MNQQIIRIYGCPLENLDVSQCKTYSPFNVWKIRRGKFIVQKSKTSLFDALRNDKSKIIYKYIKDVIIDEDKTYKRITRK